MEKRPERRTVTVNNAVVLHVVVYDGVPHFSSMSSYISTQQEPTETFRTKLNSNIMVMVIFVNVLNEKKK